MTNSYAKTLWLAVFAAALLLLPSSASAQSATVTDDGFVSTSAATQSVNFNGQGISLLVSGASAAVGSTHVGATKTFLRFQLASSLPPGVTASNVAKATLKLYVSPGIVPSGTMDLYTVSGDWNEATLNPSSPPAISSSALITGIPVVKANSFLVVDVTQLVQAWLKGAADGGLENHGIALVASTSTTYVVFDSKESIVTSHEPRLEIVLASDGPAGTAATIHIGSTTTVGPGGQASVTNSGTQNAAVLNFSIPQGPIGTNGQTGPPGQAASVQVGTTMTVPAGTPASVLNGGTQNAAVLNFLIPQGLPGTQGAKGDPGPMGLPGLPGPPGQNPVGAALTTASNTFAGNQTINGNLILGSGGGVQFADGSIQTTASIGSGGGVPSGYMITGTTQVAPPGYTLFGSSAIGNLWAYIPPMPTARSGLAAAAVNGKIYAIGGIFNSGSGPLNTVEVYDPSSNSWSTAASMPTARNDLAAAAVNGKIYAIGGFGLNTVEVYDPSSNSWSTAASMPTVRSKLAVVAVNGKIYAIGGIDTLTSLGSLNTVEVYDPGSNSWSVAVSMPTARSDLAAAAVNGKIYAIGGFNGTGFQKAVEVYEPSSDSWSIAAPMLTVVDRLGAAAVNGKIYAIGGRGIPTGPPAIALTTVEVYDPSFDAWSTAASMPTARFGLAAADANGLIYAIGGTPSVGNPLNAAEQFSPPVTIYTFIKN